MVLPLAIRIIHRLIEYLRASRPRPLAVRPRILYTHLHCNRAIRHCVTFRDGETSLTGSHLYAMIPNPQPHRKTKCLPQPLRRKARIGIAENRNHSARRNRTIESQGHLLGINKF